MGSFAEAVWVVGVGGVEGGLACFADDVVAVGEELGGSLGRHCWAVDGVRVELVAVHVLLGVGGVDELLGEGGELVRRIAQR